MPYVATASGRLEYLVTGTGSPTTVFAHGLAATIAETRPLGSGVLGSRVFFSFRGHGRSDLMDGRFDYTALASDLTAVADHTAARRALGVSVGAGALVHVLAGEPDHFERVVFFLPAVLDRPRTDVAMDRLTEIAGCLERRDIDHLTELLIAELPDGVRALPQALDMARTRARLLVDSPLAPVLRALPVAVPIPDRRLLRKVRIPTLVVGQAGDSVHPAEVAEELAAALPNARLHVFSEAGAIWLARRRLREVIAGFLNAED